MASLLRQWFERGLVAQVSDEAGLAAHLETGSRTVYCGFDPSAASLQVGNLVPLLGLRRFQRAGHRPILLIGGATGLIGDPGGKSEERALHGRDTVRQWADGIREQASGFLDFSGAGAALVVDNLDWTADLPVVTFLRDVGKHFSVNAMVRRDSVRSRLTREGAGISYTEFSYMVLQAMDFLELARRHDCSVQIGGSDQWGNIVGGVELIRRALAREAYALTTPLVTKADGRKFGKSESGTVWLDPSLTSPYAFYQFWLNAADADVPAWLRCFTLLEVVAIDEAVAAATEDPGRRAAQKLLAGEVTRLVHGETGLRSAERITAALFGGDIHALGAADFEQLRLDGMGCTELPAGTAVAAAMADAGLAPSRGAARRLISSGGVSVNGAPVRDVEQALSADTALHGRYHLIRRGRKAWHLAVHATT